LNLGGFGTVKFKRITTDLKIEDPISIGNIWCWINTWKLLLMICCLFFFVFFSRVCVFFQDHWEMESFLFWNRRDIVRQHCWPKYHTHM